MSFWGELKRRNVYKVGVAYAIVAWLIVQAAAIVFPHMDFPEWTVPFVIVLLIIGFPLILLFAWAFEITPEGIKRTKEVPLSESITHLTGKKLNYILAGLLVIALGYIVILKFFAGEGPVETELTPTVTEESTTATDVEEAPKTIAVIPFVDISPESDQGYFVDGLSEELINCLTKIGDLRVIARTSSFAFKDTKKTVQEIADALGADHVLEGSVRKAGNELRITAQLIQAVDGIHLWSETYDRELEDIFEVQENIATTVADRLKATLGIDGSLEQLGGTDNKEAYELYLTTQGMLGILDQTTHSRALKLIDAAIALDPEFAMAWVLKARLLNSLFIGKPDEGLKAAQKAIEIEPNLMEAYNTVAIIREGKGEPIKAGLAFQKAAELSNGALWKIGWYAGYLVKYGYLERAREVQEAELRSDPLNKRGLINASEIFGRLGELQRAEEAYERVKAMYGEDLVSASLILDEGITYARLGSGNVVSRNDILSPDPIMVALKEYVGSPKEGLAELRRFYNDDDYQDAGSLMRILMWAAYFGDPEFAIEILEKLPYIIAFEDVWYPSMKKVRQLSRFKELVRKKGLVDYWNKFGWPDMCRPLDNGDFECD